MKHYYYLDDEDNVFRITAKRKPGAKTQPYSGTWVVRYKVPNEYKRWCITCFPEITWGTLQKLTYIGSLKIG
jgi:hypothetical protein